MIDDIKQMRSARKQLGLTQKELAKHSGVSQSLIAKIESGMIDPSYTKVKKIMETLQSLRRKEEKCAADVMVSSMIRLSPKDSIKQAIAKMKRHDISQMPVFDKSQAVGLVTELVILDALTSGMDVSHTIERIMLEAPPTLSKEAKVSVVSQLLRQYPLVIISEKGKALGVITKADLFNSIYR